MSFRPEIRAAWFDIDHTLLEQTSALAPEVLQSLALLPARGVNTARSITQIERLFSTELNLPAITLTGAEIWQVGGEMIQSFPFDQYEKEQLSRLLLQHLDLVSATIHLSGTRTVAVYAPTEELLEKAKVKQSSKGQIAYATVLHKEFFELFHQSNVSWINCKWKEEVPAEFAEHVAQFFAVEYSGHTVKYRKKGVNKGSSLRWLCEYLGIDPANVLTAGDKEQTDSDAFAISYGVAVGEVLLPHANHLVKNPSELAAFLQELLVK